MSPDDGLRAPAPGDGFGRAEDVSQRRWQRACDHYHAVLVEHLRLHGARTTEQLVGRIGWFHLPFTAREVVWLVESARRRGLIAPLGIERDARGANVEDEWTPTEKGLGLRAPRGQRVADVQGDVRQGLTEIDGAATAVGKLGSLLAVVLTLGGFAAFKSNVRIEGWLAASLTALVSLMVVAAVLAVGVRGAHMLRDAVVCWPRLVLQRPACHRWIVTRGWRHWVFPLGAWVVLLLGEVGFLTRHYVVNWVGWLLLALAGYLALVLTLLRFSWLGNHALEYRAEFDAVRRHGHWGARARARRVRT